MFLILVHDFPNEAIKKATVILLVCHQSDESLPFYFGGGKYKSSLLCLLTDVYDTSTILSSFNFQFCVVNTDVDVGADLVPSVTVSVVHYSCRL